MAASGCQANNDDFNGIVSALDKELAEIELVCRNLCRGLASDDEDDTAGEENIKAKRTFLLKGPTDHANTSFESMLETRRKHSKRAIASSAPTARPTLNPERVHQIRTATQHKKDQTRDRYHKALKEKVRLQRLTFKKQEVAKRLKKEKQFEKKKAELTELKSWSSSPHILHHHPPIPVIKSAYYDMIALEHRQKQQKQTMKHAKSKYTIPTVLAAKKTTTANETVGGDNSNNNTNNNNNNTNNNSTIITIITTNNNNSNNNTTTTTNNNDDNGDDDDERPPSRCVSVDRFHLPELTLTPSTWVTKMIEKTKPASKQQQTPPSQKLQARLKQQSQVMAMYDQAIAHMETAQRLMGNSTQG